MQIRKHQNTCIGPAGSLPRISKWYNEKGVKG